MTRNIIVSIVLFSFAVLAFAAGTVTVQVKETQVRDTPSFTGKSMGKLVYGDKATVLEEKGAWMRVTAKDGGLKGWLHASAVTKKDVTLSSKGDVKGASSTEAALATKGFNAQVEAQYRSENAALDFASIDEMEAIKVKPEEMTAFLKDGGIVPEGGGL